MKDFDKGYQAAVEQIKQMLQQQKGGGGGGGMGPQGKPDHRLKQPNIKMPNNPSQGSGQGQGQQQKQPRIGDKGDSKIQELEDIERRANAVSDDAGDMMDDAKSKKEKEAAQKLKDQADKVAKAAKDLKDGKEGQGEGEGKESQEQGDGKQGKDSNPQGGPGGAGQGSHDSSTTIGDRERVEARLQRIRDALDHIENKATLMSEVQNNQWKERRSKQEKEASRYAHSPLMQFQASLNQFIRRAIALGRNQSWKRPNKKISPYSNIKIKGVSNSTDVKVPSINVYFDMSGSWDERKIEVGKKAVATLNHYVWQKKIKIKLYYFSNEVYTSAEDPNLGGGTSGQPILDHIEQTRPDNVIVMTDSDISDCSSNVTVPGAVWFLFKDGRSQNLVDHLHGALLTKEFEI